MVHVDTWQAAYRGLVPDDYLDGLSYDDSERLWQDVIAAGDGRVFVAEAEGGIFGFASGRPRERFSRDLTEYEGEPRNGLRPPVPWRQRRGRTTRAGGRRPPRGAQRELLAALGVRGENRSARGFYESLGGIPVAEDDFEIGGARLTEVAYGWKDLGVLL